MVGRLAEPQLVARRDDEAMLLSLQAILGAPELGEEGSILNEEAARLWLENRDAFAEKVTEWAGSSGQPV